VKKESHAPPTQQPPQPLRKIFGFASPQKSGSGSNQSIATNASYATAFESAQPNESITTNAASFVDFSDEENTQEDLNFGNDPLAVLSRTDSLDSNTTPTEISFNFNPEETTPVTMPSKQSTEGLKTASVDAARTSIKNPKPQAAPAKDPPETIAKKAEDVSHFDVAQNVYGTAKNFWAWGKTVPVVSTFLDLTEAVAGKVLDTTVHMDLPAIDQKAVTPQLKKLDDVVVTPVILALWNIIGPVVARGDEMVVKPVMTEVVPRVLAPLGIFDEKKKAVDKEKKAAEEKKAMIDSSPTPEVVPALS